MYITPKQKKKYVLIASIIALAIPITVLAVMLVTRYFSNASSEIDPKGVVLANVTSNSVTVTWVTEVATTGSIVINSGSKESKPYVDPRGSSKRKTHYIEVNGLEPGTAYSFTIISNSTRYSTESGNTFKFQTSQIAANTPVPNPVYGTVTGSSSDDVLVYIRTDNSKVFPAATTASSSGNWIIDLSALRDLTTSTISITDSTNLKIIVRAVDYTGAVLSATYKSLFGTEGKLVNSSGLALEPSADIINEFAQQSVIASVVEKTNQNQTSGNNTNNNTGGNDGGTNNNGSNTGNNSNSGNNTGNNNNSGSNGNTGNNTNNNGGNNSGNNSNNGSNGGTDETPASDRKFRYVLDVDWAPISGTDSKTSNSVNVNVDAKSAIVTNLTDTSFTVLWVTSSKKEGYLKYGTEATKVENIAYDERDGLLEKGQYTLHSVKVSKLQPETTYYYDIYSGTSVLKNGSNSFNIKTYKTLSTPPDFKTISGKLEGLETAKDGAILATIKDSDSSGTTGTSNTVSALPDETGNWIITIGDLRGSDGSSYFNATNNDIATVTTKGYFETTPATEKYSALSDKTFSLAVKSSSSVSKVVKVGSLNSYGIYSANKVTTNQLPADAGGPSTLPDTVPQTGLVENLLVTLGVGVFFTILGSLLFIRRKHPKKLMSDRVF